MGRTVNDRPSQPEQSDRPEVQPSHVDVIKSLRKKVAGPFVARTAVEALTGGAITARNLANLDAAKSGARGPRNRFYVGRKVVYPVDDFISWLLERASPAEGGASGTARAGRKSARIDLERRSGMGTGKGGG